MAALLFISFIVLLLIGVPVAFAIAAAASSFSLKGDVKLLDPRAAYVRQHRFLLPDRGSVLHLCR